MKSNFTNHVLIYFLIFSLVLITSSKAAKAIERLSVLKDLKALKQINKIELDGNIKVYLKQGLNESLEVYGNEPRNTQAHFKNGILYISSDAPETLEIGLTVNNLSSIVASGNAVLCSTNRIRSLDLEIKLEDSASAKLELEALNVFSSLEDWSSLELTGNAETLHMDLYGAADTNTEKFSAENSSLVRKNRRVVSAKTITGFNKVSAFVLSEPETIPVK